LRPTPIAKRKSTDEDRESVWLKIGRALNGFMGSKVLD